ncbi:MAG: hypothetical protein BWZ02_02889 [Lentisphaerae bacterium ADurb.BinA184]|nr:MAG: hypothetical protein BWZ02_02889 [Lentisphaerae bacterium ADurb.BinA184]
MAKDRGCLVAVGHVNGGGHAYARRRDALPETLVIHSAGRTVGLKGKGGSY